MKRTISRKMALRVGGLLLIAILGSSIAQSQLSHSQVMELTGQRYWESLAQMGYSTRFLTESAHNLLGQLSLDPEIRPLTETSFLSAEVLAQGVNRLKSYSSTLDFIQSVVIYNGKTGRVFSTITGASDSSLETYFDRDFVRLLNTPSEVPLYRPVPRQFRLPFQPSDLGEDVRVFAFFFVERDARGTIESALVVNVSVRWFEELLRTLNRDSGGNLLVLDQAGQVVAGGTDLLYVKDEFLAEVQIALRAHPDRETHTVSLQSVPSLLTSNVESRLGWTFVRTMPLSQISQRTTKLLLETWLLSLVLVLGGGGGLVLLWNRLFAPLRSRIDTLERHAGEAKQTRLREWLTSGSAPGEELPGLPQDRSFQFALLLRDAGTPPLPVLEHPVLAHKGGGVVVSEASWLVYSSEGGNWVQHLQEWAVKEYQGSLTAVLSAPTLAGTDIPQLFQRLLEKSRERFFAGPGLLWTLEMEESSTAGSGEYRFPVERFRILLEELKLEHFPLVVQEYRAIVLSTHGWNEETLQTVMSRLHISVCAVLEEQSQTAGFAFGSVLREFLGGWGKVETLQQAVAGLEALLSAFSEKLTASRGRRHDKLLGEVVEFIAMNLSDPNLGVEVLAADRGFSALYLSRLFRRRYAQSVAEFINEARLRRSVELLTQTNSRVREVALASGFQNTKYFFTLFRKRYGVTPLEYRSRLRRTP